MSGKDTRWLEMHGGSWRVTVAVPRRLHGALGTRLKRSLNTDSLAQANRLKHVVLAELRREIEKAEVAMGLAVRPIMAEALNIAKEWREPMGERVRDELLDIILHRAQDIQGPEIRIEHDEEGMDHLVYDARRAAEAKNFIAISTGRATPIDAFQEDFLEQSVVKARTDGDAARAIKYLMDWCRHKDLPPTLQSVTGLVAVQFMDDFAKFTGIPAPRTRNKYFSRLRQYWAWLLQRKQVEANVWLGVTAKVPKTPHGEEERAFTDEEVAKLLMGGARPKMMDLMMIGALTGARLDAIVDLKVKDCADGSFTFKPQKKENTSRDVPIHPDLKDIVARRVAGKKPADDLFPDWPKVQKEGSKRERSFKASNAFTEYRRKCGVAEVIPGKRRSLVNFHSFRRWFITKAERAGFDGDLIAAIVGHKRSGLTLGRYSEGPEMRRARKCVAAVKLPKLDGSPIIEAKALTPRKRQMQKQAPAL